MYVKKPPETSPIEALLLICVFLLLGAFIGYMLAPCPKLARELQPAPLPTPPAPASATAPELHELKDQLASTETAAQSAKKATERMEKKLGSLENRLDILTENSAEQSTKISALSRELKNARQELSAEIEDEADTRAQANRNIKKAMDNLKESRIAEAEMQAQSAAQANADLAKDIARAMKKNLSKHGERGVYAYRYQMQKQPPRSSTPQNKVQDYNWMWYQYGHPTR